MQAIHLTAVQRDLLATFTMYDGRGCLPSSLLNFVSPRHSCLATPRGRASFLTILRDPRSSYPTAQVPLYPLSSHLEPDARRGERGHRVWLPDLRHPSPCLYVTPGLSLSHRQAGGEGHRAERGCQNGPFLAVLDRAEGCNGPQNVHRSSKMRVMIAKRQKIFGLQLYGPSKWLLR